MQDDNPQARYRSLVLSHLYVAATKRRISIDKLPPDMLDSLGVSIVEGPARSRGFSVQAPSEEGALNQAIERLERDFRENSHLFPKGGNGRRKKHDGAWHKQGGKKRNRIMTHEIIEEEPGDSW